MNTAESIAPARGLPAKRTAESEFIKLVFAGWRDRIGRRLAADETQMMECEIRARIERLREWDGWVARRDGRRVNLLTNEENEA